MSVEQQVVTEAQRRTYNDLGLNRAINGQPMEKALQRFRCQTAVNVFSTLELDGPILDAGCGEGHVMKALVEKGLTVVGLEIADKRIQNTKAAHEEGNIKGQYEYVSNRFGSGDAFS